MEYTFIRQICWLLGKENADLSFDDLKNESEPSQLSHYTIQLLFRVGKVCENQDNSLKFFKMCRQQTPKTNSEFLTVALAWRRIGQIESSLKCFVKSCETAANIVNSSAHLIVLESAKCWYREDWFKNADIWGYPDFDIRLFVIALYDQFVGGSVFQSEARFNSIGDMSKLITAMNYSFKIHLQKFMDNGESCNVPSNAELRVKLHLLKSFSLTDIKERVQVLDEGIVKVKIYWSN